jgi:hypothetical protein
MYHIETGEQYGLEVSLFVQQQLCCIAPHLVIDAEGVGEYEYLLSFPKDKFFKCNLVYFQEPVS